MDAMAAAHEARALMDEHGLQDWDLEIARNKFELGRTFYERRVIQVSKEYMEILTPEEVRETVLHEIAHALSPNPHWENEVFGGHGLLWEARAMLLGITNPKAGYDGPEPFSKEPGFAMGYMLHRYEDAIFNGPAPENLVATFPGRKMQTEED